MNTILTDDERPKLPAPALYDGVTLCKQGKYTGTTDGFTTEQMEAYADAREAAVLANEGAVVVTWNYDRTRILAVTRQNAEGQILKVIAEAPAEQAGQMPRSTLANVAGPMAAAFERGVEFTANRAAPEAPAQAVSEREAFEAHEQAKYKYPNDGLTRYPDAPDQYALPLMQARWEGWQARAKAAAALARIDALGGGE